jgi:ABC-2 type transport system permease protein
MIRRILAIGWNTFTELVRLKVFYFILIFALLMIGNSAFMAQFRFQEEFQMLKDISLGSMSIFTSLLAILATANFLPKDMEDRTIYTILAKPVPRFAYLMGKLYGILLLLFLFTLVMSALFVVVLWLRQEQVIADIRHQAGNTNPQDIAQAIKQVTDSTFNINLIPGIAIIFAKAALLAAMTLFISSFSTSGIFTILISIAIYFIGHMQATARDYWLAGVDIQWWTRLLVALIALFFPDLQAFNLSDDVVAGTAIPLGLFLQTFALGWFYVVVYFALAAFVFSGREL